MSPSFLVVTGVLVVLTVLILTLDWKNQVLNSTPNWKTYTNHSIGFSLKYPENWNLAFRKVQNEDIDIIAPEEVDKLELGYQSQAVYIQIHKNPTNLTSREYFDQVIRPSQAGSVCTDFSINTHIPDSLKNKDITIIEGLCGVLNQGPRTIITKSNSIIDISSSFIDKVDNNLIYQIIATYNEK